MSTTKNISKIDIGYRLKKTQHALRLHMDEALSTLQLTTPQYAVLAKLNSQPNLSNADLARASFITPQSMHAIVINLEKRALVKKETSKTHKRILITKITKKGIKILQRTKKAIKDSEALMLKTLSKKEIIALETLLAKCFDNLQNKPF